MLFLLVKFCFNTLYVYRLPVDYILLYELELLIVPYFLFSSPSTIRCWGPYQLQLLTTRVRKRSPVHLLLIGVCDGPPVFNHFGETFTKRYRWFPLPQMWPQDRQGEDLPLNTNTRTSLCMLISLGTIIIIDMFGWKKSWSLIYVLEAM